MREAAELREANAQYHAQPLEDNLFEWHFTVQGPSDSDFSEGRYHGRILLPPEYPMKPPSIILITPNGRFELGKKICLSMSAHHPETWQPSWSIRTVLLALIGFMPTKGGGAIGALDYTPQERKVLALRSQEWTCDVCGVESKHALAEADPSNDKSSETDEAKELAAQITFKGETEKSAPASQSSESTPEQPSTETSPLQQPPLHQPQQPLPTFFPPGFQPGMMQQPGVIPQQPGVMQNPPCMMQPPPGMMQSPSGMMQSQSGMIQHPSVMMPQPPGMQPHVPYCTARNDSYQFYNHMYGMWNYQYPGAYPPMAIPSPPQNTQNRSSSFTSVPSRLAQGSLSAAQLGRSISETENAPPVTGFDPDKKPPAPSASISTTSNESTAAGTAATAPSVSATSTGPSTSSSGAPATSQGTGLRQRRPEPAPNMPASVPPVNTRARAAGRSNLENFIVILMWIIIGLLIILVLRRLAMEKSGGFFG